MNYLAHIYLSGNNEEVTIGNFIGDYIKGKDWKKFPKGIQTGILLHREIDSYTDSHPVVTFTKERLRPSYSHYSPVISDIFYDHFLAALWDDYSETSLIDYTNSFYTLTDKFKPLLPAKAIQMLFYMKRDNWLYNYQHIEGINQALSGMARRTSFRSNMENAAQDLRTDYESYQNEFCQFFPDLERHANVYLQSK